MMIVQMQQEHFAAVKSLLDRCFGDGTWSADMLRSQLDKPDSRCTVAVEDDRIVGFLAFEQVMDEGSVIEVAVHPDDRRRGIARRLIGSSIDHADGLSVVFLEVRESNLPAIRLYESLGFERIGIRKDYYDRPKENAVLMKHDVVS